eukprot:15087839-Alexandrium_andersonii.AAC.1
METRRPPTQGASSGTAAQRLASKHRTSNTSASIIRAARSTLYGILAGHRANRAAGSGAPLEKSKPRAATSSRAEPC